MKRFKKTDYREFINRNGVDKARIRLKNNLAVRSARITRLKRQLHNAMIWKSFETTNFDIALSELQSKQ